DRHPSGRQFNRRTYGWAKASKSRGVSPAGQQFLSANLQSRRCSTEAVSFFLRSLLAAVAMLPAAIPSTTLVPRPLRLAAPSVKASQTLLAPPGPRGAPGT